MPAGRPSNYDPKLCKEIVIFFNRNPLDGAKFGDKGQLIHGPIPPTFERFAHNVAQVDYDTILRWTKEHEEFCGAYKKAKHLQRAFYTEALASGLYSGAAPIFTAKNETDMVDKQLIDHTTKGESLDPYANVSPETRMKMAALYESDMKKSLTK